MKPSGSSRIREVRQSGLPVWREQAERLPPLAAPALGDLAALEYDVADAAVDQAATQCESCLTGADHDGFDLPHHTHRTATAISTGTPLVMTSKTAERARDCSTIFERLGRGVAGDGEGDANPLVTVSHLVRQPEDPAQIDVAFDVRFDAREGDAAGGGNVGDAGGQTARQRVQEELDRRRRLVGADKDGRMVGVVLEDPSCLCSPPAPLNDSMRLRLWVPRTQAFCARNWKSQLGRPLDDVDRGEEVGGIDAVQRNRLTAWCWRSDCDIERLLRSVLKPVGRSKATVMIVRA